MNTHTSHKPMSEARREKVTVTLRPERVAYADRKAQDRGVSRSEAIDALIAEAEAREIEALMVAGYKALAQENLKLAEEGMESFWEVIKDDPADPSTRRILPPKDTSSVRPIGRLSAEKVAEVDLALHRSLGLRCPRPR